MNKEYYNDPTVEKAISNVMREEKRKALKKKKAAKSDEYKRQNELRLQKGGDAI